MNEYNENGEKHGPWEYYYKGKLWYKENYINGKMHGLCEDYYWGNGQLSLKFNVINGKRYGLSEYYSNGELNIKQYYL